MTLEYLLERRINYNYIGKDNCNDESSNSDILLCKNGHSLLKYITQGGFCNICKKKYKKGNNVMDCRQCNYWICLSCANDLSS